MLHMEPESWIDADIRINLMGVPIQLKAIVPAHPVKPQAMLPIFQQLSGIFCDIAVKAAGKDGRNVSCKAGCGACCRQPVPLAEIEMYHIAKVVEDMPEPRRSEIKRRFHEGAWKLYDSGWYEKFEYCANEEKFLEIAFEYFSAGISCPFLEEGACSIYEQRPIICREYMVSTPAENCQNPSGNRIDRLPMPASATDGTCRVGRSQNMSRKSFHLLIFALMWVDQRPENFPEKTGEEWLKEFFGSGLSVDKSKAEQSEANAAVPMP